MKTEWRDSVIDVNQLHVLPGHIKINDLILDPVHNEYAEVVTIQKEVPRLENLSHRFTMFTLQTRDGTIYPLRGNTLQGKQTVLRRTKKVIFK